MQIAVIGGGVYGAGIAYNLAQLGADEVSLYEKGNIAEGSTGKSAAIVRQHYSDEDHMKIAKHGRDILANFEDHTGYSAGFHQNGYLITSGPQNERAFREIINLQQKIGVDVELLEPDEISEHMPAIDTTGISVAAIEHDAGFADSERVTRSYIARAEELGADIHTNTPVMDIEMDGNQPVGITTPDASRDVDYVVNAAGPWGGNIAEMVSLDVPLEWHESRMAELEADKPYGVDLPTVSDVDSGLYAKPNTGGYFVAGGAAREEDEKRVIDRSTGLRGVNETFIRDLRDLLNARLPGLSNVHVRGTWSGIITATPDWHQIVGVPEGYENFYNILGPSGHGFKEAPAFAESIAQEILGKSPNHDLSSYRLERFKQDAQPEYTGKYGQGSRA